MSDAANRWSHAALNLALLLLGVAVMALLYALVSQNLGRSEPSPGRTSADRGSAADARDVPAALPEDERSDEIIQVGVRNGCGKAGLAAETRGHLVRSGFDVVEVGNYSSFDVDSSRVVDRVGNRAAALRVARAMGLPTRRVERDIGEQYHLDATVVLGCDYPQLTPFRTIHAER